MKCLRNIALSEKSLVGYLFFKYFSGYSSTHCYSTFRVGVLGGNAVHFPLTVGAAGAAPVSAILI